MSRPGSFETRPNISENDSKTFFVNFFEEQFRDVFWYQIVSYSGSKTFTVPNFFPDQLRDFFGTKFLRYLQQNDEFPGAGISGTGTSHSGPGYR